MYKKLNTFYKLDKVWGRLCNLQTYPYILFDSHSTALEEILLVTLKPGEPSGFFTWYNAEDHKATTRK